MSNEKDSRNEVVNNSLEIYEAWREDQLAEDDAEKLKSKRDSKDS